MGIVNWAFPKLAIPLLALFWALPTVAADVDCVRRDREINRLKYDNEAGGLTKQIELVKGYDCGGLRVEFVRLSEVALAMLEGKYSKSLDSVIGDAKLVETLILRKYLSLRSKFGTSYQREYAEEQPFRQSSSSDVQQVTVVLNPDFGYWGLEYFPAVDEMLALSRGMWPKPLTMFVSTGESTVPLSGIPTLWRSLTSKDILDITESTKRLVDLSRQYGNADLTEMLTPRFNNELDFLMTASADRLRTNSCVFKDGTSGLTGVAANRFRAC